METVCELDYIYKSCGANPSIFYLGVRSNPYVGASTVKWTEIVLRCVEIVIVVVEGPLKVVAKCCLKLVFFPFFHGDMFWCVE